MNRGSESSWENPGTEGATIFDTLRNRYFDIRYLNVARFLNKGVDLCKKG